ncbi:hypothetical protein [Gluconobacter sp. NFX36]|uniref:hypothetical protein n=1 Tax=Gluconobacter sp. NFX36 TaxID=2819535 RepID=UPI003CEAE4D9
MLTPLPRVGQRRGSEDLSRSLTSERAEALNLSGWCHAADFCKRAQLRLGQDCIGERVQGWRETPLLGKADHRGGLICLCAHRRPPVVVA